MTCVTSPRPGSKSEDGRQGSFSFQQAKAWPVFSRGIPLFDKAQKVIPFWEPRGWTSFDG